MNIIGKTVGEVFDTPGINIISDKVITYAKYFDGENDSFNAISKAVRIFGK